MKENRFNYVRTFINIVVGIVFTIICYYFLFRMGFIQWLDLEPKEFYSNFFSSFFIIMIVYYISYYVSIIWHELGHLFFGKKANLKFGSLNFLLLIFTKDNNKIVVKRQKIKKDFKGMCYMLFDENKEYSKKEIVLYFMGGIIFNLLMAFTFIIVLFFSNNIYLDIICSLFILSNIYLALYNSVPFELKSLAVTDMLQIIYCLKDPEYIKIFGKCTQIQNLLSNGVSYKDMDKKLFLKPKMFNYQSDVLMALFYIDYITSKEKYDDVVTYINIVLKKANNILSKNQIQILKIQLIVCALTNEKNYEIITEYWDEELENYLLLMGRVNPYFIYIDYLYQVKFSKNKVKANEALKLFYLMENKYSDKKAVDEINEKINELRKEG